MPNDTQTDDSTDALTGATRGRFRRLGSQILRADPRAALVNREFSSLLSEKTIVLALIIQLFVAGFSSFLVVGLVTMYDPGANAGEIQAGVAGNASATFMDASRDTPLQAQQYDSIEAAEGALNAGSIDAAVYVYHADKGQIHADVYVPRENIRTTLAVSQLQQTFEEVERIQRDKLESSLTYDLLPLPSDGPQNPYYTFTYTVLLPLLMFLPVFISGSVVVDTITEEIERGTLEVLRTAPITALDILDAKVIAATLLGPGQAGLWLVLLMVNGIGVQSALPMLALVTAFTAIFVTAGVGIALLFKTREKAQLLYSVAIFVIFGVATFAPEHPANTVARLAVGAATQQTYTLVGLYAVVAALMYVAVRTLLVRTNAHATSA